MAPPLTPAAARIVDPVLSTAARGYRNEMHAWPNLFPVVPVGQRGGKIVEFRAEDFQELAIQRAPGSNRAEINIGYSSRDYALVERALDGKVPIEVLEDANAVPAIDLGMRAVHQVMAIVSLQIEIGAAKLATTAANYTADHMSALAGGARWSHADSTPAQAVEAAKEEIAEGIGMEPNVLILGQPVYRALKNHPDVIDRIKHTEGLGGMADPMVNAAKLASYFDVEMVIPARARSGVPGAFTPVWGEERGACLLRRDPAREPGLAVVRVLLPPRGLPHLEPRLVRQQVRFVALPDDHPRHPGDRRTGRGLPLHDRRRLSPHVPRRLSDRLRPALRAGGDDRAFGARRRDLARARHHRGFRAGGR